MRRASTWLVILVCWLGMQGAGNLHAAEPVALHDAVAVERARPRAPYLDSAAFVDDRALHEVRRTSSCRCQRQRRLRPW